MQKIIRIDFPMVPMPEAYQVLWFGGELLTHTNVYAVYMLVVVHP